MKGTDWDCLLDSMQGRIEVIEKIFEDEADVAVEPFVLPEGLGPLPRELRDRAERLLGETLIVEGRLEELMDTTARQLRRLPGPNVFATGRPAPTYVDQSA